MLMPTTTRGRRALRATIVHQDSTKIPLCAVRQPVQRHITSILVFASLRFELGLQVNRFASVLVYLNDEASRGASE